MRADPLPAPFETEPEDRGELTAEELLARLDAPMGALGVLFALLVLVETLSKPTGAVAVGLTAFSWLLWAVFALEFVVRAIAAPSAAQFLRRNWWQVIFLVLPFLRFLRFLRALRALRRGARLGRVVSSMVRTTRTAARRLSNRIAWVGISTACVIVGASQIVFELSPSLTYADALYGVAMATIAGQPLGQQGWLRVLDVLLAVYSVGVFAALAGTIGTFLLERHRELPQIAVSGADAAASTDSSSTATEMPPDGSSSTRRSPSTSKNPS